MWSISGTITVSQTTKINPEKPKATRSANWFFVLSDFFEQNESIEPVFKKAMTIANKRHDIIAITLNDPRERELPDCGLVALHDAETGANVVVDSGDVRVRAKYRDQAASRLIRRDRLFRSIGVDHIDVATDVPYEKALISFFMQRKRRIGR